MQTYLVTGGCGFIGSHLVQQLLAGGARVRVVDDLSTGRRERCPADIEFMEGDVADTALIAAAMDGVDGCFHLAAVASVQRSIEAWAATSRTNMMGTVAVFEAARRGRDGAPVPVVYASSSAVYGDATALPLREQEPARPLSPYAADKAACELHARAAWKAFGIPNVGFRLFNVYGPGQDPGSPYSGVISRFSDQILRGVPIEVFGDGTQARDFVFVADVACILQETLSRMARGAGVYNLCTGRMRTLNELVSIMAEVSGARPERIDRPFRPGDVVLSCGDPSLLERDLGLRPTTDLETGLGALLRPLDAKAAE